MKEELKNLIVSDSGWKYNDQTSRPRFGIRDYDRIIEFSRSLDQEELKEINSALQSEKNCPGRSAIKGFHFESNFRKYIFSTTMDSSD